MNIVKKQSFDRFMTLVVARAAIFLGLNLNRVFFPKLAKERGEPWRIKGLRGSKSIDGGSD